MREVVFDFGPSGMPLLKMGIKIFKYNPNDNVFGIFETKTANGKGSAKFVKTLESFDEVINYFSMSGYDLDILVLKRYTDEIKKAYSPAIFQKFDLGVYNIVKDDNFSTSVLKQIQKFGINSKQAKVILMLYKD